MIHQGYDSYVMEWNVLSIVVLKPMCVYSKFFINKGGIPTGENDRTIEIPVWITLTSKAVEGFGSQKPHASLSPCNVRAISMVLSFSPVGIPPLLMKNLL